MSFSKDLDSWTYGIEYELADWTPARGLPAGWGLDRNDVTMVNSDGIAVDPKGICWPKGGEALSRPTGTPASQGAELGAFLELHPDAAVNYRSNMHIHVRVPGLCNDLEALKKVQTFNKANESVLHLVDPIPLPTGNTAEELAGAKRRYRRRLVSHHKTVSAARVKVQLKARTVAEFFRAEVPVDRHGNPLWHAAPRAAINLRHLQVPTKHPTETVEFRHFAGTLDVAQVVHSVSWCRDYLALALGLRSEPNAQTLFAQQYRRAGCFPRFAVPYVHWMENRYRATCHNGSLSKDEIMLNIKRILDGVFDNRATGTA